MKPGVIGLLVFMGIVTLIVSLFYLEQTSDAAKSCFERGGTSFAWPSICKKIEVIR